jgi:hypothetical protein
MVQGFEPTTRTGLVLKVGQEILSEIDNNSTQFQIRTVANNPRTAQIGFRLIF